MRILTIFVIVSTLLSVGCSSEKSDYDAGIAAYRRGHYETALYDFEQREKKGDPIAQFCLGYMYKHGKGVRANRDEAERLYRKSAEQDYVPAQNNLAEIYFQQVEEASRKSVSIGDPSETIEEWAHIFKKEWMPNYNNAMQWFQKAAVQQNNHVAQYNLALTNYQWAGEFERVTAQVDEALKLLGEDSEDPDVQELVETLKSPEFSNLPSDAVKAYEESVNLFTMSAGQGYDQAQYELAKRYYTGEGIDKNMEQIERWEKAVELYTKAARKGNADAQFNLALMYDRGEGIDKNLTETERLEKAIELYTKAARKGNADAQFNLAEMYINNLGVDKNLTETERMEKAIELYTKAAREGNANAQNNLANRYADGEGVPKNPEKAFRLYFKAAQQGNVVAQVNVGESFEKGKNEVPQDNAEAYYWYSLALRDPVKLDTLVAEGKYAAIVAKWHENIGEKLGNDEKNEIQSRVNNWMPRVLDAAGTGFYIDKEHILTNAHVVTDKNRHKYDELCIGYRYVEEKPEEPGTKSIDHDVDLALLLDPSGNKNNYAKFRSRPVDVEEDIALFGYPLSFDLSYEGNITLGIVSALLGPISSYDPRRLTSYNPRTLFQHTAPQQGGNSGGPVFDSDGNVIGVSVSGMDPVLYREGGIIKVSGVDNISFAIKFDIIKKFLKEDNNINIVPVNLGEKGTGYFDKDDQQKIKTKAQKFTFPVLCFKNKERVETLPLKEIGITELGY